ncbi:hypothetical protein NKH77_19900 [Streptomyces sp. M19]
MVELDDVLGPGARLLVERMASTDDWAARFDLLDRALLDRLERAPLPRPR